MMSGSSARPCLCSLESVQDGYLLVNVTSDSIPKANDQPMATGGSWTQTIKHAFLHFTNLQLKQESCCHKGGWKIYNQDGDNEDIYANRANTILLDLNQKIQENRQPLQPPITQDLALKGYKYSTSNSACNGDKFQCVYYLWIQAGENFSLYAKAGVTPGRHGLVELCRLTSKEDTLCTK